MASYIFGGDTGETPESIKRKRELAAALMLGNRKAPQNVGEGLNAIGQALIYRQMMGEARAAEQAGLASGQQSMQGIIEGMGRGYFPPAPSPDGSVPMPEADMASARVAQAHGDNDLRSGIISTAKALGIDATDLATAISYETAGTFNPTKRGPRTQWGQHRGLIQFGEPQAKEHGVDWNNPVGSQLGPDGAVASYLRKAGVQPGMGLMDVYSAINAGGVGRYNASDANNGGAPGTVADKVNNQMAGHRQKALALLGSEPASPVPATTSGLTPEALQAWASQNYQPSQAQGISPGIVEGLTGQPSPGTQPRLQPGQPAPAMPPAQPVSDMPVAAAPEPRLEMSGNVDIPQPTGPTIQELAAALGNPHLPEHFRPIAQALLGQQMQQMDPMRQLDMDYKRAQIEKMQREAAGGGQAELGLNPQYGVDAQGNPVLIQIGKDGRAVQTAMPDGVSLSKEPIKMDAGTHFVLLDPITRQPVGQVPKDNYQEAFDKGAGGVAGKAQAEAAANLPTDLATAQQAITELDQLIDHPGLSAIAGPFDQYRPSWTMGSEGRDALARFNQAKGRAFLQAFGMLKGGGPITEIEGVKAEQAMARMDRAQGEAEFKQALIDFRDAVKTGMDKMRQRAGGSTRQPVNIGGYTIEQVD